MTNNKKVIKIQCPFERIKKYNSNPEASLYKAVIMQMIIDASNNSTDPKACRNEKRAKAWLFGGEEDFYMICRMASIEPKVVLAFAKTLIRMHAEKGKIIRKVTAQSRDPKSCPSILAASQLKASLYQTIHR